jgi:hypothetical protein
VFFIANALPRINIGDDVWGELGIMTGVINADARQLCTSDGVGLGGMVLEPCFSSF